MSHLTTLAPRDRRRFRNLAASMGLVAACTSFVVAGNVPGKPAAVAPALPPATPAAREAAAIAFAREHHPELASLLDKLSHDNRREYQRAVRELSQAVERLARLKKQSPPQYGLSLAAWKLDSRAQLLAARMTMSQDPVLEDELKNVLRERADVRLREYQLEREHLEARLKKLNAAIESLADKNVAADKDLQRIKRTLARNRGVKAPTVSQSKTVPSKTAPSKTAVSKTAVSKTAVSKTAPSRTEKVDKTQANAPPPVVAPRPGDVH